MKSSATGYPLLTHQTNTYWEN